MEIDINALDWQKLSDFHDAGNLKKSEFESSDEYRALWDGSPAFSDLVGDSYIAYNAVLDDASMFDRCAFEGKEEFVLFAKSLLNEEIKSDLKAKQLPEHFAGVVRPERVKRLAEAATAFDLDEIRNVHNKIDEEGVDFGTGELIQVGVQIETDEFVDYLQKLIGFVKNANESNLCLVFTIT